MSDQWCELLEGEGLKGAPVMRLGAERQAMFDNASREAGPTSEGGAQCLERAAKASKATRIWEPCSPDTERF